MLQGVVPLLVGFGVVSPVASCAFFRYALTYCTCYSYVLGVLCIELVDSSRCAVWTCLSLSRKAPCPQILDQIGLLCLPWPMFLPTHPPTTAFIGKRCCIVRVHTSARNGRLIRWRDVCDVPCGHGLYSHDGLSVVSSHPSFRCVYVWNAWGVGGRAMMGGKPVRCSLHVHAV